MISAVLLTSIHIHLTVIVSDLEQGGYIFRHYFDAGDDGLLHIVNSRNSRSLILSRGIITCKILSPLCIRSIRLFNLPVSLAEPASRTFDVSCPPTSPAMESSNGI